MSAPIIVTALFGAADFAWLDGERRTHFPAERNQVPAHLTLFHHLAPSLGEELDRRLREATAGAPPAATITGLLKLGGGVGYRVESVGLAAIRAELAAAFAGMLTPQDARGWRAHVTIQNKVAAGTAAALHATLADGFAARPLAIVGLASWWYRDGPWEARRRHMFRGQPRPR